MPHQLYIISLTFSCLALIVSVITAWLTFFRKGKLLMTKPTLVFFGPDGSNFESSKNKVYLRTLLYSTAKRGHVLDSIYVSLSRNESKQNFNVWAYGEKGSLKRGSGLFIPQEGIVCDHHFLLPNDGSKFDFHPGSYKLTVYANLVGDQDSKELCVLHLSISDSQAKSLSEPNTGVYFDWGPDQQTYHAHIESKPNSEKKLDPLIALMANE